MSTLSVIRGALVGLIAVAAPSVVLFVALGYTSSSSVTALLPYAAILVVALALVAFLACACVRIAHFSSGLAIVLPTLPFIILTLATLPSLAAHTILPVLFWAVQLAVAVFVARTAARRAVLWTPSEKA